MRIVIQRVSEASVVINKNIISATNQGYLILLAIGNDDNIDDINWLIKKIVGLRVFSDSENKMNLSLLEIEGEILLISQFTLQASTKKGNRPSYLKAAKPDFSIPMYERFVQELDGMISTEVKTGKFGTDMQVDLLNDGPVTIWIDSKNRV